MSWYKYIKPYLFYFIITPICMLVEVAGEIIMPTLLGQVIDSQANGTLDVRQSLLVMGGIILCAILMMAGGVGGSYFGAKASVNFAADLRQDVFEKVQGFSFANIDKFSTGSLVTRLTNDITQMQNFVNMLLRMAFRAPGMLIMALFMTIRLQPKLSVVFAVTIPLLLICVGSIIVRGFSRFGTVQKKLDSLNSVVQENVTNVRVVKSFVREKKEISKFKKANGDFKEASMSAMNIMIFMSPVTTLIMNITILLIIYLGSSMVLDGLSGEIGMGIGDLSKFVSYANQILFSLMMVSMLLMMSSRALASARRVKELLEEEPDIKDLPDADPGLSVKNGEVEFRNVSFRYYKGSDEKVLDDISLKIPARSVVGIIGSTGCGKTTLVSMISRLYDPGEGEVLVDGRDVKDYTIYNLREGIGMVLQNNTLFSGTIEENLRWGDENATMEEIKAAAHSAQADKFVSSFKDGYSTELDQGGTNVSGGQKQRLCIARALLKRPKVLILDDSTSAVDTATEAQIRSAFKNELSDSTKIIIAQRISSIIDSDMIVVMNEGRISGVGTHDELLKSNQAYQEIYYSQNERKGA